MTSRIADERGSVTLLIIGFAGILLLAIAVVTDASKVFLAQRALSGTADAAALAAANAVDETRIYRGGIGAALPLSSANVASAAAEYASEAGLAHRFDGFGLTDASTDGVVVRVGFGALVRLPFFNTLLTPAGSGFRITATASATAGVR